jgi:hypothetical protein
LPHILEPTWVRIVAIPIPGAGRFDLGHNLDPLPAVPELARFEQELQAARLRESSIHTYIDRT